ncbi:tryptophan 2,3-dioxygenase [Arenibaculum pallidiluteum]|uniref:tryptophan 2,3-dioxygenase n=1 Tax=Arenibaculum pallidiluteum TaxID=2812559 RepID=UPI001A9567D4|nr:tryptophan 2,3-dioxygenase [Arenibaculum pallidiluteum]
MSGPEEPREHTDFRSEMSYGDYLGLDTLLGAQQPRTANHNELLFIVQHQTTELWLKLAIHELTAARGRIAADDLGPAFKMLARVKQVMGQLIQAWDVLSTLTPSEYSDFRGALGRSSGFQSYQYRAVEFLLGNKDASRIEPHRHRTDLSAALEQVLREPSLYDEALRALGRAGFSVPPDRLERDWTQPYEASDSVRAAWLAVYRDPEAHWQLYELAEKLVDLEDAFRQWRFRHVTTVERVIGAKSGTGGTAGVRYLRRVLEVRLFPELWDLRTEL